MYDALLIAKYIILYSHKREGFDCSSRRTKGKADSVEQDVSD